MEVLQTSALPLGYGAGRNENLASRGAGRKRARLFHRAGLAWGPWRRYDIPAHPDVRLTNAANEIREDLMLPVDVAIWLVRGAGAYLLAGFLFAIGFAFWLVNRLDPVAAHGTRPFRVLIIPGATLLWPLLLTRVLRGDRSPPTERTAHRRTTA